MPRDRNEKAKNSPSLQQRLPNLHLRTPIPHRPPHMRPQLHPLPQRRQHDQIQETPRLELQPRPSPYRSPCHFLYLASAQVLNPAAPLSLSCSVPNPQKPKCVRGEWRNALRYKPPLSHTESLSMPPPKNKTKKTKKDKKGSYGTEKVKKTNSSILLQRPRKITAPILQAPLHIILSHDPLPHRQALLIDRLVMRRIHATSVGVLARARHDFPFRSPPLFLSFRAGGARQTGADADADAERDGGRFLFLAWDAGHADAADVWGRGTMVCGTRGGRDGMAESRMGICKCFDQTVDHQWDVSLVLVTTLMAIIPDAGRLPISLVILLACYMTSCST